MDYAWDEFTHDFAVPASILIKLYGDPIVLYHDLEPLNCDCSEECHTKKEMI